MAITVPIVSEWNKKALEQAAKDIDTFGKKAGKSFKDLADVGKKVAVALGAATVAAVTLGKKAVDAASDLGEEQSKTNVIFADGADEIEAFARQAAQSLGQSQVQAMRASNTFATFGKAAGLAGDDLVTFATDFTALASDLASFNNTTPDEAITAIGAALRGESEPLRAYGVLLNDATLKAAALELGIYDGTGALTAQQKILAAQAEIYKQTGDAQGDFARTSDGLANSQRILSAEFENLQARIGEKLLPIALKFTDWVLETLLPALERAYNYVVPQFESAWRRLSETLGPIISQMRDALAPIVNKIITFMKENTAAVKAFFAVLAGAAVLAMIAALAAAVASLATPVVGIVVAVAALSAAFVAAYQNSADFRAIVDDLAGKAEKLYEILKKTVDVINQLRDLRGSIPGATGLEEQIRKFTLPGIGSLIPFADGGIVTGPTPALIGEAGPEAVIPLDQLGRFGGMNVTINMPAGSDGAEVVRVLEREARLRGSLPVRTAAGIKL